MVLPLRRRLLLLLLLLLSALSTIFVVTTSLSIEEQERVIENAIVDSTKSTATTSESTRTRAARKLEPPESYEPFSGSKQELDSVRFDEDTESRLGVMKQACHRLGLDTKGGDKLHQMNPFEYFVNEDHNLVWCNVFKSGSSSWVFILNQLAGVSADDMLHLSRDPDKKKFFQGKTPLVTTARNLYGRPSVKQLKEVSGRDGAVTFLVGREPFQRLVSGFRDKFEKAIVGSKHDKIGRKIVAKYRPSQGISKKVKKTGKTKIKNKKYTDPNRPTCPTFPEFVWYLLDEVKAGNELDMHWTPVHSFCNPCQVNISHVVKFETFDRDQTEILALTGIQDKVQVRKVNSGSAGTPNNKESSTQVTQRYLQQLLEYKGKRMKDGEVIEEVDGKDLFYGLCRLYLEDFEIFGYEQQLCKDLWIGEM